MFSSIIWVRGGHESLEGEVPVKTLYVAINVLLKIYEGYIKETSKYPATYVM